MVPAAQVLIAVLPLVAVVLLAVMTFFFFLWDYRTKRLIIEKGQQPVPRKIDDKLLLLGIVSLFVGVGLLIFFSLYNGLSNTLLGGIIPVTAGLGIITHYVIMHGRRNR
ncbi:MAG TPA: DUF6249 domain-containing protein [Spirochaetia bacterium]|nr:DUF6249 domain-containing protein [Spirochaetia bacterium]